MGSLTWQRLSDHGRTLCCAKHGRAPVPDTEALDPRPLALAAPLPDVGRRPPRAPCIQCILRLSWPWTWFRCHQSEASFAPKCHCSISPIKSTPARASQLLDGHSHSIVLVRVPIVEDVSFCLSITFLFIIFPSLVSISLSDISLFGFVLLDSSLITLL